MLKVYRCPGLQGPLCNDKLMQQDKIKAGKMLNLMAVN